MSGVLVVENHLIRQPEEQPGVVDADPEPVMLLAGVIDRKQMLSSPFVPSHHPAAGTGRPSDQVVLWVDLTTDPEHPTHIDPMGHDSLRRHVEEIGEGAAGEAKELGRSPQMQFVVDPFSQQLPGFDR